MQLRLPVLKGRTSHADEREERPPARDLPTRFDDHDGLKVDGGLPVAALLDSREVAHGLRLIAGDAALDAAGTVAVQDHVVLAYAGQRLPAGAAAHRQHRDQHGNRAGDADDDRQDRTEALPDSGEAHEQQRPKLSGETHAARWPASAVTTRS